MGGLGDTVSMMGTGLDRIGYGLPTVMPVHAVDPQELTALARTAVDAGFGTLWTGDHLILGHPILEPVAVIATLARSIPEARLGTAVLLPGLRPAGRVGREVASLVSVTGGRLELGVGIGGDDPVELAATGLVGSRATALDRAVEEILAACGDRMPPVWVGGRSDAALERAKRLGGWLGYLESPQGFSRKRAALEALGTPTTRTGVVLLAAVTHDAAEEAQAMDFIRRAFRGAEEALLRLGVIGDEQVVAKRACEFLDAGCDHLILWPLGGAPAQQLERLTEVRALTLGSAGT